MFLLILHILHPWLSVVILTRRNLLRVCFGKTIDGAECHGVLCGVNFDKCLCFWRICSIGFIIRNIRFVYIPPSCAELSKTCLWINLEPGHVAHSKPPNVVASTPRFLKGRVVTDVVVDHVAPWHCQTSRCYPLSERSSHPRTSCTKATLPDDVGKCQVTPRSPQIHPVVYFGKSQDASLHCILSRRSSS